MTMPIRLTSNTHRAHSRAPSPPPIPVYDDSTTTTTNKNKASKRRPAAAGRVYARSGSMDDSLRDGSGQNFITSNSNNNGSSVQLNLNGSFSNAASANVGVVTPGSTTAGANVNPTVASSTTSNSTGTGTGTSTTAANSKQHSHGKRWHGLPNRKMNFMSKDRQRDPSNRLWILLCGVATPRNAALLLASITCLVLFRSFMDSNLVGYGEGEGAGSGGVADLFSLGTTSETGTTNTASRTSQLQSIHKQTASPGASTLTEVKATASIVDLKKKFYGDATTAGMTPAGALTTARPPLPPPKFAYAFLLGGLPTPGSEGPALGNSKTIPPPPGAYLGLIYNVLVSIHSLQQAGSKADFFVFVHMASPTIEELSPKYALWFQDMNVTLKYTPPSPSYVNEISTIVLEKFRILELLDYDRVLYLNPDVFPYCNLDYIMELSYGHDAILQSNFLMSIGDVPTSGSFFMLQPAPGAFQKLIHQLAKRKKKYHRFMPGVGYGVNMTTIKHSWRSLGGGSKRSSSWGFEGGDSDQGLLLHYAKYTHGNVSIAIGDEVEHFQKRKRVGISRNGTLFNGRSCLPWDNKAEYNYGMQWFVNDAQRAKVSPRGLAPYRDFANWQYNKVKPWHYQRAPPPVSSLDDVKSARKYWFYLLRQVDAKLNLGVDFQETQIETNETILNRPEKFDEKEQANWNYVPMKQLKDLNPVFSAKVHSLQQWALRIENPTLLTFPYEPPVLKESPFANKQKAIAAETTSPTVKDTSMEYVRSFCSCPDKISTDPCTSNAQPLEDWLGRRVKYYLSKRRPLCPNAARTKMHVVLPLYNLHIEHLTNSVCSIACQDYPELSLLVYDDGSENEQMGVLLEEVFGPNHASMDFTPPPENTSVLAREKFAEAANVTRTAIQAYKKSYGADLSGLTNHVIRSTVHSGSATATFWALKLAQQMADANDVVMLVYPGDELLTHRALQQVNAKYIDDSAWATIGAHIDLYETTHNTTANNVALLNMNATQKYAVYRKFHTFKAHLIDSFGIDDVVNHENDLWMRSVCGRTLFHRRIIERVGLDRTSFISDLLYKMNRPEPESEEATHVLELPSTSSSRVLKLPVHVVLSASVRGAPYLAEQLTWLQQQSITRHRQMQVHVVNTDKTITANLQDVIKASLANLDRKGRIPIQVNLADMPENWRSSTKYLFVHELRKTTPLDAVVLLDDNQYWPANYVESLINHQQPKEITTWKGKAFLQATRNAKTGTANFWVSDVVWSNDLRKQGITSKTVAFGLPNGALFDPNLWLVPNQLLRLTSDLREYKDLDSLWLSYLLDALLGWQQRMIDLPIPILESSVWNIRATKLHYFPKLPEDVTTILAALAERERDIKVDVIVEQKQQKDTLQRHRRRLLEDRSVFMNLLPNEKKNVMFRRLQTTFHWNVFRQERMPIRSLVRPDFAIPSVTKSSPPRPGTADDKEKRAFVCVTGQFDRFELENKIDTIFRPMQKEGYSMDAALVLSSGAAKFTNHDKLDKDEFIPFYTEFEDAVRALERRQIRVLSRNGTYTKMENPPLNQKYLTLLHESQKYWRSWDVQVDRVKNHARIFDSYRRCLDYADAAARDAGFHNVSQYYHVIVRIRDDSGLNMPLDRMGPGGEIMNDLIPPPPNSVTVTECRDWWGMNDRMAIVSPDIAHLYFTRPFDDLSKNQFFDETVVINPESFLLNVYNREKIHVLGHPDLKRVNRVVKQSNGEVVFFKQDKFKANCPEPFTYLKYAYELFGWAL